MCISLNSQYSITCSWPRKWPEIPIVQYRNRSYWLETRLRWQWTCRWSHRCWWVWRTCGIDWSRPFRVGKGTKDFKKAWYRWLNQIIPSRYLQPRDEDSVRRYRVPHIFHDEIAIVKWVRDRYKLKFIYMFPSPFAHSYRVFVSGSSVSAGPVPLSPFVQFCLEVDMIIYMSDKTPIYFIQ